MRPGEGQRTQKEGELEGKERSHRGGKQTPQWGERILAEEKRKERVEAERNAAEGRSASASLQFRASVSLYYFEELLPGS